MVRCQWIVLSLTVLGAGLGPCPAKAPEDGGKTAWLKKHAVAVRTIDPQDEDFKDLMPLVEKIGNARVVALGEQSHGDGAAFLAKHRLVRFLHQKMGFDVLAWESGLFDCREMDAALLSGTSLQGAVLKGLFPIWGQSQQVQPVLAYATAGAPTGRRLEMAGFDCQFSSIGATRRYLEAVEDFFDRASGMSLKDRERERLAWLLKQLDEREPGGKATQLLAARRVVQGLIDRIDGEKKSLGRVHSTREMQFMKRTLANLLIYDDVRRQPKQVGPSATNLRDKAMGENLVWLAREFYPDRKIIVWAASFHLLRNAPAVQWLKGGARYAKTVPMGGVAHKALGRDYYSVMFTASDGQAGRLSSEPFKLPAAPRGSLEHLLEQTGRTYAFLDFRSLPEGGEWLTRELAARPLGYTPMKANWTRAFDAVFYTRTMFPSSMDARLPAGVLTARPDPARAKVARALEEYRKTLIGYNLDFDSIVPPKVAGSRPWTGYDARRLARYPTADAWPDVLGHVDSNPASFTLIHAKTRGTRLRSGALAFTGPLADKLTLESSATVLCLGGVTGEGAVTAKGYTSVVCHGTLGGTLFFDSYATALVKGDVTGQLTAKSYLNCVVTGKFSGKLCTKSYAMVYLLGGFSGEVEMGPSRLYIAGRTTRADLARIKSTNKGWSTVYLEESDLPAGRHQVGGLDVTVAKNVQKP